MAKMKYKLIKFISCIIISAIGYVSVAQSIANDKYRRDYIRKYSSLAIREMEKSGIPASITLAQGILESGSGNSTLAKKAKNHFGIKCHNSWEGDVYLLDDDKRDECFRVYNTVEESYLDHTEFLTTRDRYSLLFGYSRNDYKSWARGLKTAGYATDQSYDRLLIKIIEENQLYLFDSGDETQITQALAIQEKMPEIIVSRTNVINAFGRQIFTRNRTQYILARKSDNFEKLTDELDLLSWQLSQYNEFSVPDKLIEGEIIYIKSKKSKADKRFEYHLVQENETMYSISQQYGIKLNRLYSLNRMPKGSLPGINNKLALRKRIKKQKD